MDNRKANPDGYMTTGELAKYMNTTVRTLQYYDKEGILSPSALSPGGKRLYTQKDCVLLYQILSFKYLGFSLAEIKNQLILLETPEEVLTALSHQYDIISNKISILSKISEDIKLLQKEISQMHTVDFKKYADIVSLLRDKNDFFWIVKHFDEEMLTRAETQSEDIVSTFMSLCNTIEQLQQNKILPTSAQGIEVGKNWWDMVNTFTGGDMSLLPKLISFAQNKEGWDDTWKEKMTHVEDFLQQALDAYFAQLENHPLATYKSKMSAKNENWQV